MADFRSERWNRPRTALRCAALVASLALAAAVSFAAPKAAAKVTSVRFWSMGESTRIAIEVSADFRYRSEHLANPERLFFDIQGAKPENLAKGMQVIAVGDPLLKQIRVAETQPGVTRVVLDLVQPAEFTASQLSGPDRLMIEIRSKSPAPLSTTSSSSGSKSLKDSPVRAAEADILAAPAPLASLAPSASLSPPPPSPALPLPIANTPAALAPRVEAKTFQPPPVRSDPPRPRQQAELINQPVFNPYVRLPRDPLPPPSIKPDSVRSDPSKTTVDARLETKLDPRPEPAAALPSAREPLPAKNGARSLTRVLGLKLGRVVIDPGHGGHDAGTHGPSGLYEKDVVLDVALRLGALLENRLGSEVVYTRESDVYIPLEERTRIANEHKADLFLSIHANSSPYRTAAGVETYYLNFTTSRAALDLAARENAGSQKSVFDLKEILQKIALKDKIDESREFAGCLQTALYGVSAKGNTAAKNRGIKKAPFVVLIGASMPSVLAEIGFLTNAADETLLRKPEHREKIAEALYKGIASYADTLSHFQVAKNQ